MVDEAHKRIFIPIGKATEKRGKQKVKELNEATPFFLFSIF
jgi:hypothetical protein